MSTITISQASQNLPHWINKVNYGHEAVVLTSSGRPKAMLISIEMFQQLLGIPLSSDKELMLPDELSKLISKSLHDAGYKTKQDVIDLVRDVRRELYNERYGSE